MFSSGYTRPEGIVLVGLLYFARLRAGRTFHDWAIAVAGGVAGAVSSATVNWITGHHLTPLTMQGRAGIRSWHAWQTFRFEFIAHTVGRMLSIWNIYAATFLVHGHGLLVGIPLVLLLATLIFLAVEKLRAVGANRWLLLCVWGACIEVLYLVILPTPGHGGRYIAVVVMLFLPLIFLGLHEALMHAQRSQKVAWLVVVVAVMTGISSLNTWRRVAIADICRSTPSRVRWPTGSGIIYQTTAYRAARSLPSTLGGSVTNWR